MQGYKKSCPSCCFINASTNLGVAGVAPPSPSLQGWSAAVEAAALSPVGELLVMRGGSEYHLVSRLVAVGVFRM